MYIMQFNHIYSLITFSYPPNSFWTLLFEMSPSYFHVFIHILMTQSFS